MPNLVKDADIRRLKTKGERPELISLSRRDEVPHGGATLCVRVHPTGEKSWIVRFRRKPLPSLFVFGKFCEGSADHMPLALARHIHAAFNQAVENGDPTRDQLLEIAREVRSTHGRVLSLVATAETAATSSNLAARDSQSVSAPQANASLRCWSGSNVPAQYPVQVCAQEAELSGQSEVTVTPETVGVLEHAQKQECVVHSLFAANFLQASSKTSTLGAEIWTPTLKDVFDQYLEALESRGSLTTARDYKSAFRRHIELPHPALAVKLAHEVTSEEMTDLIHEVYKRTSRKRGIDDALAQEKADARQHDVRTNKLTPEPSVETRKQKREAERVRSMLRTAFNSHIQCKNDSTVSAEHRRASRVLVNPLQHITAIPGAIRPRRRQLTPLELGFFMLCLDATQSPASRALKLVVWLGGQRVAQVLRATEIDVDKQSDAIMLRDPKGKRVRAREHLIPLVGPAKDFVNASLTHAKSRDSQFLFTTSGRMVLSTDTVSDLLLSIKLEMLKCGVISTDFDVRDIRRTFETYLARMKVDDKTRAHLFSHGIGGVQDEHYNLYEYFCEKQEALNMIHAFIEDSIDKARSELGSLLPKAIPAKVNGLRRGLYGLGSGD